MRIVKDDSGRAFVIGLDRHDTLEEMAAMAGMTMEDLAIRIEYIIMESRRKKEE